MLGKQKHVDGNIKLVDGKFSKLVSLLLNNLFVYVIRLS